MQVSDLQCCLNPSVLQNIFFLCLNKRFKTTWRLVNYTFFIFGWLCISKPFGIWWWKWHWWKRSWQNVHFWILLVHYLYSASTLQTGTFERDGQSIDSLAEGNSSKLLVGATLHLLKMLSFYQNNVCSSDTS